MNKEFPVTTYLDNKGLLHDYQEHVKMLDIQARGRVLIIGPGLQEIAVIEPAIRQGKVKEVTLIGENPLFLEPVLTLARENYPIPIEGGKFKFRPFI